MTRKHYFMLVAVLGLFMALTIPFAVQPAAAHPSYGTPCCHGNTNPTPTPTKTPTPKPTATPTPKPTQTATPTPRPTQTPSPTATATPKPTQTPSPTASPTPKPTQTATPTPKPTQTATPTPQPTATPPVTPPGITKAQAIQAALAKFPGARVEKARQVYNVRIVDAQGITRKVVVDATTGEVRSSTVVAGSNDASNGAD